LPHGTNAPSFRDLHSSESQLPMHVTLTVCTTCTIPTEPAIGRDGERLAMALEQQASARHSPPQIVRHECLWACSHSCAILIRSRGRTGYLAGRFEPSAEAAAAILDWARAYGESPDGRVPYGCWPNGIKGHFIARIPVLEEETR
jgi:predicted metal-binding protein